MSHQREFEVTLRAFLDAQAPRQQPTELLDAILGKTSRMRPLPAWRALLTAPVMRTQTRVLVGSPAVRLAYLTVTLALLTLALLAAAFVASQARVTADELVRRSQEVHDEPPPFTMIITAFDTTDPNAYPGCSDTQDPEPIRYLYFYDGEDGFRYECLRPGMARGGDFEVRKAGAYGSFYGGRWEEPVQPRSKIAQAGAVFDLNWRAYPERQELERDTRLSDGLIDCPDWALVGRDFVAGRPAWQVSCGDDSYWIDEASHLLVRVQIGDVLVSEALELEVGVVLPADLFAVAPPSNARLQLVIGQIPPDWTLPLYEMPGGTDEFSSARLKGRPAVVLFHVRGCRCIDMRDFARSASGYADRVGAVIIRASDPAGPIEEVASLGIPMVADLGTEAPGWDAEPGTVAFLDADGRVVALTRHRLADSLSVAIDAFLAGEPVPAPPVGEGVFVVGEPAPQLAGQVLVGAPSEGDYFDLALTRGKPAVVLSSPALLSTNIADVDSAVATLASAAAAIGDEATFVVVAWEPAFSNQKTWSTRWQQVAERTRSRVGDAVDDLVVLEGSSVQGDSVYEGWHFLGPGFESETGEWPAAIVVLDAEGRVAQVLSEPLPESRYLVELLRELSAGRPQ